MSKDYTFASQSVTEGHPDKLCDQISDALVDRFLRQDRWSRISAECAVANGIVFVAARFESTGVVDIPNAARDVIRETGYEQGEFNARNCTVITSLSEPQPNPNVNGRREPIGEEIDKVLATDQCVVFGFACRQTDALMPLPLWLAHKLVRRLDAVRRDRLLPYLEPEGKADVSVEFRERRPCRIQGIHLTASQRAAGKPALDRLRRDLREFVIEPVFADEPLRHDQQTRIDINVYGAVVPGGPYMHAGLTGRKPAVDTYGEYSRHSSRALSGKDPSRISRVAHYGARYAAKNVVAAGLADECEVQLAYTHGHAGPISVEVETYGANRIPEPEIVERVKRNFDLRLAALARQFRLRELPLEHEDGFYRKLAVYGHVGRQDLDLPWELTDRAQALGG